MLLINGKLTAFALMNLPDQYIRKQHNLQVGSTYLRKVKCDAIADQTTFYSRLMVRSAFCHTTVSLFIFLRDPIDWAQIQRLSFTKPRSVVHRQWGKGVVPRGNDWWHQQHKWNWVVVGHSSKYSAHMYIWADGWLLLGGQGGGFCLSIFEKD